MGMIVYLLGIIFILLGLYSVWTKKPGVIARENVDELLNVEKYSGYVQRIGIVYIGIGGIMIFVEILNNLQILTNLLHLIILLCLSVPVFNFYQSLNKRYFDTTISSSKDED